MRKIIATIFISFLLNHFVNGQETTANLSGSVIDPASLPVVGATVVVKHDPTGFTTATQTNNRGVFFIPNLKPGGPYTIRITFVGLREEKFDDVNLSLGNNPDFVVNMKTDDKNIQEV